MKIVLEFDTLTDFHLAWLRLMQGEKGWQSAEDVLRPLISAEFYRLNPPKSNKIEDGSSDATS